MCAACDASKERLNAAHALRTKLEAIDAKALKSERRELKLLHPVPENNEELSELFLKVVGGLQ